MTKTSSPTTSLTQLLSPTMVALLVVFFRKPNTRFYLTELVKLTGKYPNSVSQGLKTLVKLDLIQPINQNQLKFYSLNQTNSLVDDLENMLIKTGHLDQARAWASLADWLKNEQIPYQSIDNNTISLGKKHPIIAIIDPQAGQLQLRHLGESR